MKKKQSLQAILYPTKIIIVTVYHYDDYMSYSTDNFTILSIDVDDNQLGKTVNKHLEDSKYLQMPTEEKRKMRKNFLHQTGLKTEKAYVEDAKYLDVEKQEICMTIRPHDNRLSEKYKLFYFIPSSIITCPLPCDNALLGSSIREGWTKCLFS